MTEYLVVRLFTEGDATDRVILFHVPHDKAARTHIRRIQQISDWRYVGRASSERDDLDKITSIYGISDADLKRRTGVDVTGLRTVLGRG